MKTCVTKFLSLQKQRITARSVNRNASTVVSILGEVTEAAIWHRNVRNAGVSGVTFGNLIRAWIGRFAPLI